MSTSGFSLNLFDGAGRILLLGSLGYSLFRVVQGRLEFEEAILSAIIACCGLYFYQDGFRTLASVSDALVKYLGDHMDKRTLQDQLIAAIQKTAAGGKNELPSTGEMIGQLWRAGVWEVVSSLIELLFLVSDYLILVSAKVFLAQVLLIFPLACGLFPIFPKIFSNLLLYAVELSLWRAMLVIIHEITALVGHEYLVNDSTQGLQIIAVELVAIYLVINIPKTTHQIMQGALAGDHGASGGFVQAGKKAMAGLVGALNGK